MNFSYPFYDTNSPYYESKKLWGALALSKAGSFTLGGNGFWHGGVHFESGAGIPENRAVRAIADGKVVAYRLNKEYLKKDAETQGATEYEYSTSFVLIKHNYESLVGVDAQGTPTQNKNELEFYSLYMHLKPYSEYSDDIKALSYCEGETQYQVTEFADDGSDNSGLNMRPTPNGNPALTQLPIGTRVKIGQTQGPWGKVSEIVSGYNGYEGELGWIFLTNNETEKLTIPNQFDAVRNISEDIKAGQKIGYMGKYDAPASSTNGRKQLHLEIFTTATQAEITAFLSNNANVNLPETHDLYNIPQNSPFASMQAGEATEGTETPPPTFTEYAETHFQSVLINTRELTKELKTDSANNKWLPLTTSTHASDNKKDALSSEGWVKVTGADPSNWPGFDNPPLDAITDGVGYYDMASPTALMTTLVKRVEPSYISGAETPISGNSYIAAAKQMVAKDAVSRSIIKHKVEWSSTYTSDLMTVVTEKELIPDDAKRTRFKERKEELDFWEELTDIGTSEAYYFHPLAFIDNMMRMGAYYEAVIHVTSEIKTAIVLNANGSVASAPDYGGYNGLVNGYTVNNNIYSKKKSATKSYFPTFKGYIYRGIGNEAKLKLAKDLENNNRKLAENDVLEFARHTKKTTDNSANTGGTNGSYNKDSPVPPTAEESFYEVRYRLSSTYRYRISSLREEYPAAFPDVPNNSELSSGFARIVPRLGANTIKRDNISFDPWKSKDLEGCLGVMSGSGSYAIAMTGTSASKYINISEFLEGKVPELKGVYGRLYAPVPSVVTEYNQHTKVWVQIDSLPDVDHIINGGE